MAKNTSHARKRAQTLAETSLMPLADIARETGLSVRMIGQYAEKENWQRPPSALSRTQIVARLWQSAGQNLESIETQLKDGAAAAALRDLAMLTKIMRDLSVLDAPEPPHAPATQAQTKAEILRRLGRIRAMEAV